MKKWLIVGLAVLILSGCSLQKFWKWFDELEWEREDTTISVIRFPMR